MDDIQAIISNWKWPKYKIKFVMFCFINCLNCTDCLNTLICSIHPDHKPFFLYHFFHLCLKILPLFFSKPSDVMLSS